MIRKMYLRSRGEAEWLSRVVEIMITRDNVSLDPESPYLFNESGCSTPSHLPPKPVSGGDGLQVVIRFTLVLPSFWFSHLLPRKIPYDSLVPWLNIGTGSQTNPESLGFLAIGVQWHTSNFFRGWTKVTIKIITKTYSLRWGRFCETFQPTEVIVKATTKSKKGQTLTGNNCSSGKTTQNYQFNCGK